MRFLDALNTPKAVVIVLVAILAVNGFLLYQQRDSSSVPANSQTPATNLDTSGRSEPTREETSRPKTREETTDQNRARARTNQKETTRERTTSNKRANRRETTHERTGGERTNREQTNQERASRKEHAARKEPQKQVPAGESRSLADLGGVISRCRGSKDDCIRNFVLESYPKARYIGGRTDLGTGRGASNVRVFYFEDPQMKTCQYRRESYRPGSGPGYTVIVIGEGSFNTEKGNGCIPTA